MGDLTCVFTAVVKRTWIRLCFLQLSLNDVLLLGADRLLRVVCLLSAREGCECRARMVSGWI